MGRKLEFVVAGKPIRTYDGGPPMDDLAERVTRMEGKLELIDSKLDNFIERIDDRFDNLTKHYATKEDVANVRTTISDLKFTMVTTSLAVVGATVAILTAIDKFL